MKTFIVICCVLAVACTASKKQNTSVNTKTESKTVRLNNDVKTKANERSGTISTGNKIDDLYLKIRDQIKVAELEKIKNSINVIFDEEAGKTQLFSANSSFLSVGGIEILQRFVTILKEEKSITVKIAAYSDAGNAAYNMRMTQLRADAVADYFLAKGISPHRIMIRWFGETQAKYKGNSLTLRAKNRRVEFLLSPGE